VARLEDIPKDDRPASLHPSSRAAVEKMLGSIPMFRGCSRKDLAHVVRLADVTQHVTGSTLTSEGEQGQSMYVLLQGEARVSRNGRKIADLGPGAVVGELALLTDQPRNATVTVTELSEIARIGRKEFAKLLDTTPSFTRKLMQSIADRLRELDSKSVQ
jgi:CRP/FNR family transcriptional regulator, cyclic AMP receptor protein